MLLGPAHRAVLHGLAAPEAEVFETFTRLEGSDRSVSGTGLGLAIVKAFAESMGMTVEAANRGDMAGARFTIHFPERLLVRGSDQGIEV